MNEKLTITVPRSHWLRGGDSQGVLCQVDNLTAECKFCIMGFIGSAFGISRNEMRDEQDLAGCSVSQHQYYADIGEALEKRGILMSDGEKGRISTEATIQAMTANDHGVEDNTWREEYLRDLLHKSFNIEVNFV